MKKSWRFLIACLLLVLLPLQGFAVAAGLSCSMDMSASGPALHIATVSASQQVNQHCQAIDGENTKALSSADLGSGEQAKADQNHDHCKSASTCCVAIALMPAIQATVIMPTHDEVQVQPVLLPASVSLSTLERPPRS